MRCWAGFSTGRTTARRNDLEVLGNKSSSATTSSAHSRQGGTHHKQYCTRKIQRFTRRAPPITQNRRHTPEMTKDDSKGLRPLIERSEKIYGKNVTSFMFAVFTQRKKINDNNRNLPAAGWLGRERPPCKWESSEDGT